MLIQIVCLRGALAGEIYPLGDSLLTIGRDATSTIRLANKLASRQHAEVRREPAGYVLHDLGSQNGTLVNDTRITSHLLRPGDEFLIGGDAFRFELADNDSTISNGPQIICLRGALAGEIYPLGDSLLTIGRDATSTIRLANKLASRQHAEVRREPAGYVLHDLGSQNGTLVNDARITSHLLRPGDEFLIGGDAFQFCVPDDQITTKVYDEPKEGQKSPAPAQTIAPIPGWVPMQVTLEFHVYEQGASITWHAPILGERVTAFAPPYTTADLPLVIYALDAAQYPDRLDAASRYTADQQSSLERLGLWKDGRVIRDVYKIVGQALYMALGDDGRNALDFTRNYAIDQRRPISYVLRFPQNGMHLAMLPWELLADHQRPVLIGRQTAVDSCERYLNLPYAVLPPVQRNQKLHILALSPVYGISDMQRRTEREARLKIWNALKDAGSITFDEITPLTRRALTDYLRTASQPPDIIHYFGHGAYRNGEGYLAFDDGSGGKTMVGAARLAALLGDVRLVVLHACQSAMFGDQNTMLSGVAPALNMVAGAVVGMQFTLRTAAAIRFAEVFYDALLAKRRSLQEAVAEGRQTLFFEEYEGVSWFVPTLYIRSHEQRPVYLVE